MRNLLRNAIARYPYRGVWGWANVCVFLFIVAEWMWRLAGSVSRYDWIEIPLRLPFVPLALWLDPHEMLITNKRLYFFALASWVGIFVLGVVWQRLNGALGRAAEVALPRAQADGGAGAASAGAGRFRAFFRRLIARHPYRGLWGWATACIWAFAATELLWQLAVRIERGGLWTAMMRLFWMPVSWLLVPLVDVPWGSGMNYNNAPFYHAAASWLIIFALGAVLTCRRLSPRVTGTATCVVLFAALLARFAYAWTHPIAIE